ncbi:MAG: NUDIX domain-containing protein [Candidatus Microsaccharimonas sp.]
MSYEADAHQAQMKILRQLLLSPEASFSQLQKSSGLSSDHTTFHIKQLVKSGYVAKKPKSYGEYILTRKGKEYANRMDTDEQVIEKQPKLSVVLVIENEKGEHLLQQRLKQPYYGYWGHGTGKIRWGETMLEAGARELAEETGLTADLRVVGFYHKLDYDDQSGDLLEDKYFCLIHGTKPQGELIDTEGQHNEWLPVEEILNKDKKFGSIEETVELVRRGTYVIEEQRYQYKSDDY